MNINIENSDKLLMSLRNLEPTSPASLIGMITHNIPVSIIDVRSSDYNEGGHIKGSENIPSMFFNAEVVKDIIDTSIKNKINSIIFYCKFGQVRSVNCAKTVNETISSMTPPPMITVSYLDGGFDGFLRKYRGTEYIITEN